MRVRLLLLLLLACTGGWAGDFQSLDSIRAAAIAAVVPDAGASADVSAEATLDPGLRLPQCSDALTANAGGRGVAEVVCAGPTAWRLFVPVRVRRVQSVLTLVRPVAAGQIITSDVLGREARNVATLNEAALVDDAAVLGRVAARTLPAGSVLAATDLQAPRLVRRGDIVVLVARGAGIEVRATGKALGDAGLAERVSVESTGSRRVVVGYVRAQGEVEVPL